MSFTLRKLKFAWDYLALGKRPNTNISQWTEPLPLQSQLWFGDLFVADLHRMFPHQGTWFSEYSLRITNEEGEIQAMLRAYMAFCEDFDRRIGEGKEHDFEEFDRFVPIPDCSSWSARLPKGRLVPMEGRMWFVDGQVSWQHPETEHSSEAAANDFWIQNAPRKVDLQIDQANVGKQHSRDA